jgi:hypothetical protein
VFRTPIFLQRSNLNLEVLVLGKYDLNTPLGAEVVSEKIELKSFDVQKHVAKSLGIVSLTGCDLNEFWGIGFDEKTLPIIALSNFWMKSEFSETKNAEYAIQNCSVSPAEVRSMYMRSLGASGVRAVTAAYLADCVFNFCNLITLSATIGKTLDFH